MQFFLANLPEIGLVSMLQNLDTRIMKTVDQILADFLILRVSESFRQFEIQPVMQPMRFSSVKNVLDDIRDSAELDRDLFASLLEADEPADPAGVEHGSDECFFRQINVKSHFCFPFVLFEFEFELK